MDIRRRGRRRPAVRLKDAHTAGHEIVAVPELLFSEIGNISATKTRLSEAAIARACSLLGELSLERFDLGGEELQGSLALSRKHTIPLQAAAYRELSRRLKCPFVTADGSGAKRSKA